MKVVIKIGASVKVLSPTGVIESGYKFHSDDTIKSGSIILEDKDGMLLKVHPDRVIDSTNSNSIIIKEDNKTYAPCPECYRLIEHIDDTFICSVHGEFNAQENENIKTTSVFNPAKKSVSKAVVKNVNYNALSKMGELWIKDDVNFDHAHVEVVTCCMLFENVGRYLTFNVYNGSYGKKNIKPPFKDAAAGKPVGYVIKNIEQLRNRYKAKGYRKHTTP